MPKESKMTSFASSLNPVPTFPEYTGPYKVGTVDIEIPVSQLDPDSQSPRPDGSADVHTILCRIFYPAVPESRPKRITWLPNPQRLQVGAYAQFLGVPSTAANIISFLPRYLHWTTIPVQKNAALLPPPPSNENSRWPTMIFSHGLGGSRNAYSHNAGSLASYGVVVICPEHRDASAALTLVRDPDSQNCFFTKNTRHTVPYVRIPHDQSPEIWEFRDKQLRIRLWEMNLVFEATLSLERGEEALIKSNLNRSTPPSALSQFTGKLDVVEPGRVIFAGHSFGAATTVQLLKSVYYNHKLSSSPSRLFTPRPNSALSKQITPRTPSILLDMWCFPLLSTASAELYKLPLPCYGEGGPGGRGILAVESDQFFKWGEHLRAKARILSSNPASPLSDRDEKSASLPHFFYVQKSAHLSQSDFAILFPWLTKKAFGSDAPEQVVRLNTRSQLQFLRTCGVKVAATLKGDLVDGGHEGRDDDEAVEDDEAILEQSSSSKEEAGKIDAWKWIDIFGLIKDGRGVYLSEAEFVSRQMEGKEKVASDEAEEEEKGMGREMEPNIGDVVEGVVEDDSQQHGSHEK
ncbi:platelet-activating factor acetylhydrolase, isoform II-domain-containing protein [Cladorrhinum samala]|uniref:Putative phospholipase n=1 Tax=Cladorrhinum samala TaxID=585594 RepID=A0AAV9HC59_9PEZI|nr:platelet-activating factor acetylhydrolase, isoform II-domain-containing protein [Cladorrhinum samala]